VSKFHSAVLAILVTALAWSSTTYSAESTAERKALAGIQTQGAVVRGTFVQEKYLAELDQPLISKGRYLIAREQGLIWRVQQPLTTTLIIGQRQLVQRNNGRETLRISADKQPGLSVVAAILLAIFQADVERLQDFFAIETQTAAAGQWSVQLRPTQASVGEFIQSVRIEGGQTIEHIDIQEAGGDRSVIKLSDTRPDANGLTDQEQAEFSDCPDC